jgi:proline iminopeptidase
MKILLSLLLFSCLVFARILPVSGQEPVDLIRDLRKIHTPNGIEVLEQVELNGSKQWISIRGKDKSNPVLLVLHGGPASPLMPVSWAYQSPWEDYFTVVNWDQRAAGKNWISTDTTLVAEQLEFRTLIRDAYYLVDHLREHLQQEKIFLMGYSYGSGIGIRMAARIPDKLHAYIGMGQMTPGKPEQVVYNRLLDFAKEAQHVEALRELEALAPYPAAEGATPMKKIITVRKWARYFNGGWYGKQDFELFFSLPELSPDYSSEEIQSLDVSTAWITRKILAQGGAGDFPMDFRIPVVMMMGKHDLHTPYESVVNYLEKLSSPNKQLISFDYSGHMPFLEEQGKFLVELVNKVRPLAD